MKQETKEEFANKHLEGFVKEYGKQFMDSTSFLKEYQKKHNLIPSMDVGKPYRRWKEVAIWNNGKNTYGFNCMGGWSDNMLFSCNNVTEVSQEEWKSMLLEKAKKDYPKGTKFYSLLIDSEWCVECEDYEVDDKGVAADGNYVFVFNIGKWAEIVEEVKTEETEKETIIRIPRGVDFEFKVK